MQNIYLPIETKVREFHGKLLFSLLAAEAGFSVTLGGQHDLRDRLHRFPSGIYIDKSVTIRKNKWFKKCRQIGNVVVAWDEEGLLFFDNEMYRQMRISPPALDQVAVFFAWGHIQKEAICEKYPNASGKIRLVGNPRFDMLRPEFRGFFREEAEKLTAKYGKIILVNTNFQLYNHFQGPVAARKALDAYPIARSKPGFYEGWIDISRKMFAWFARIIPVLSKSFPSHTIVLRPHPSENFQVWRELLKGFSNVEVSGEGNVVNWIMASDIMIHFNCTTGVEAFLLDTPAIVFRPFDPGYFEQRLPNAVSIPVKKIDELIERVRAILNKEHRPAEGKSRRALFFQRYVAGYRGALSSELILKELQKLGPTDGGNRGSARKFIYRNAQRFGNPIKKAIDRIRYPGSDQYHLQKFPGLNKGEIAEACLKLRKVTGRFENIGVHHVGGTCFCIRRK